MGDEGRVSRSDWRDNACAAVLALARRAGPTATEIYLTAIQVPNPSVREYAMFVLAAEGNDSGWDPMLAMLRDMLGRKVTPDPLGRSDRDDRIPRPARGPRVCAR
jgi:HEAT repeat protein